MEPPEATLQVAGSSIRLLGTIPGFVPDAERVAEALREPWGCVALGVPPEDLEALARLHAEPDLVAQLPEADEWTARLHELLEPFGAARIPAPELEQAYAHAEAEGVPLAALDMDDERHTEAHTRRLKLRHILRMNRRRNRMLREPFEAEGPYELMHRWDAAEHAIAPLRRIQEEREAHMADRLRRLAGDHARILAVVPAARLAGIVARLGDAGRTSPPGAPRPPPATRPPPAA